METNNQSERLKNGIPEDKYYSLLEWKDENEVEWYFLSLHVYGVNRLCDMSVENLNELYNRVLNKSQS
jgi:hypothetical protein